MSQLPQTARADPSKVFFIEMLTRDISIVDCILDLVDNAVDKALRESSVDAMGLLEGRPPGEFKHKKIHITYTRTVFEVRDTCGGIRMEEAANQVFLFGNPEIGSDDPGLSVYGIGMKRALFKLGDLAQVESWTDREHFVVEINVPKWKATTAWTFPFTTAEEFIPTRGTEPGTRVTITRLHDTVRQRFGQPGFESELRARIASTYALFLLCGLEIVVNRRPVTGKLPKLASDTVEPARKRFTHGDVGVLLVSGVAPRDEREPHGVYVFCNGRMVVEADRSPLTGWGDFFPQFHTKFNSFVAYVYFSSDNVLALPWRTTKQGVEKESPVYQAALIELRVYGSKVLSFLSELYPSDVTPDVVMQREILAKASAVLISDVKGERPFEVKKTVRQAQRTVAIQYSRPLSMVEKIRDHLGQRRMAAYRVGEYTFDYFVERELK